MLAVKQESYVPFAEDVANDILSNYSSEFDYMDWSSLSEGDIVEAFNQIVGVIATFKADKNLTIAQNRSERLSDIETCIHGFLKAWAVNEGYSK